MKKYVSWVLIVRGEMVTPGVEAVHKTVLIQPSLEWLNAVKRTAGVASLPRFAGQARFA